MTELQQYLAEEVAEDHADGIITRREAMRRLGLLGVSGAVATSLLTGTAQARQHDTAVVRAAHHRGGSTSRVGTARHRGDHVPGPARHR